VSRPILFVLPIFAAVVLTGGVAPAAEKEQGAAPAATYSPYAGRDFPARPLFGDTHLHTGLSLDAGAFGCRLKPRDAFAFAKGSELVASSGEKVRLSRPLDFLVVTDHSDQMGMIGDLFDGNPELMKVPQAKTWHEMILHGQAAEAAQQLIRLYSQGRLPKGMEYNPGTPAFRSTWKTIVEAADAANEPGRFTAFIGYEWTAMVSGNNMHRNVIFRDDATKASQVEPLTNSPPMGSTDPRDLWKWMQAYETKTGGRVLAIPHNGNLSNGFMFPIVEPATGRPVDRAYADERAKWERLYEVTQSKGDGETHPLLSPTDEFASFERWDKGNLDLSQKKRPEMLQYEYARSALGNGLRLENELGVNPYKFGMVGGTDAHTALSTADDDNFFGKVTASEPSRDRWDHPFMKSPIGEYYGWETTASGYAAVWATENTREAIFDAMQRRETYATTGPRMVVRFFGGWDFEQVDAQNRMPASVGYQKGVPMGGDLRGAEPGKAPTFLVAALKDPIGGNLDRIQIVKGWTTSGQSFEKVFDVVWAGDRKPDEWTGIVPPIGSTVDLEKATYTNTVGATELKTVWTDPEFDPSLPAFYYARVLEIPTPRWTAYDAKAFGMTPAKDVPKTIQERAWSSPIWYAAPEGR